MCHKTEETMYPDVSFPHNLVLQEHNKYQCFLVHCCKNNHYTCQPWLNMLEITVSKLYSPKKKIIKRYWEQLCLSRLNVSIHANKQPIAHRVN